MLNTFAILFSGLIAFFPDNVQNPTLMTAYLVREDAQHRNREIRVLGNVSLDSSGGGTLCSLIGSHVGQQEVVCTGLGNAKIDLTFQGAILKHSPQEFPDPSSLPVPPVQTKDQESLGWLVRMITIYKDQSPPRPGTVKPWGDDLRKYVAARMTFPWNNAFTDELDGSEEGKFARIRFTNSPVVQSVAESLYFEISVQGDMVQVTVTDESTPQAKSQTITARFDNSNIQSMIVRDDFVRDHPCVKTEDGDHFKHYYDLITPPVPLAQQRMPFSADSRSCVGAGNERVNINSIKRGLRIVQPIAPELVKGLLASRALLKIKTWAALEKLIRNLPVLGERGRLVKISRQEREEVVSTLDTQRLVQDRIICPPAMLEPAAM